MSKNNSNVSKKKLLNRRKAAEAKRRKAHEQKQANDPNPKKKNIVYFPSKAVNLDYYYHQFAESNDYVDTGLEGLADMHVHSDVPDSFRPLQEVFEEAKLRKLSYIGITDHNYLGKEMGIGKYCHENSIPYDQVIIRDPDLGLNIIPGVEVNTHYEEKKFHLTVFGTSRDPEFPFNKFINLEYQRTYMMRSGYFALLKEFGIDIDQSLLHEFWLKCKHSNPDFCDFTREDVINFVKINYPRDVARKANEVLLHGFPEIFKGFNLDTVDLINFAHDAGGIAIWAHPRVDKERKIIPILEDLVLNGLDGIEMYSRHEHYIGLLSKGPASEKSRSLLVSAGSDKHCEDGSRVLGRKGRLEIEAKYLTILTKLESMDSATRTLDLEGSEKRYKKLLPKYVYKFNLLKFAMMKHVFSKSKSAYKKYFNVDVCKLIGDKSFCVKYFNYLTSGNAGNHEISPLTEKIKELELKEQLEKEATKNEKEKNQKLQKKPEVITDPPPLPASKIKNSRTISSFLYPSKYSSLPFNPLTVTAKRVYHAPLRADQVYLKKSPTENHEEETPEF